MKRLVLGGAAMLLVLAALADRPARACIITGTCFADQCRESCLAQGAAGGVCVHSDCAYRCACISISP